MKKADQRIKSAEEIANMADSGKSVSKYFTNKGKMRRPIQRVNVDFTLEMLHELDDFASELNVSRQALIKTYLRQAMDHHSMARSAS